MNHKKVTASQHVWREDEYHAPFKIYLDHVTGKVLSSGISELVYMPQALRNNSLTFNLQNQCITPVFISSFTLSERPKRA